MDLDPVMRDITFFTNSQRNSNRDVFLCSYSHTISKIIGIESEFDQWAPSLVYGEMNTGYTGDDVRGLAKFLANCVSFITKVNAVGKW